MYNSNTICIHVHLKNRLLLVVLWMHLTVAYQPHVAPFFFMCNFHGNVNELGIEKGEVSLSVSIEGNPELYTPGKLYNGEYKPACLNTKFNDFGRPKSDTAICATLCKKSLAVLYTVFDCILVVYTDKRIWEMVPTFNYSSSDMLTYNLLI